MAEAECPVLASQKSVVRLQRKIMDLEQEAKPMVTNGSMTEFLAPDACQNTASNLRTAQDKLVWSA